LTSRMGATAELMRERQEALAWANAELQALA
jgi:hypothetical protein